MKDLEKIKSEDLAAQVQDANPGNFAIEQEVAQLVGATVPQPTEPSADDARELGAQLLVFLRRALTPIRTALRTALADIYDHLDSRCTAYTPAGYDPFRLPAGPYDPMRPFVPRTLPNLLTALTAFSARKISNGSATADGIPDGTSLAHLLCSTDAANAVTEIVDDNYGWDCKDGSVQALLTMFTNTEKLTLGMGIIHGNGKCISGNSTLKGTVSFPALKRYGQPTADNQNGIIYGCPNVTRLDMSAIEYVNHYSRNYGDAQWAMIGNMQGLYEIDFGDITTWTGSWTGYANFIIDCPKSGCLKFKSVQCSMNLMYWNPSTALSTEDASLVEDPTAHPTWKNLDQFLQNFRDHIALRLTANGSGKTLTLSQAVRDAIHAAEATYGIEAIIVTQKGWTLSPAPGASS